jgi:uncharacterized protein (DUF4415 family)
MSKTTKVSIDLNKLPPLKPAQIAELRALAAMTDSSIDFSDIPALTDEFWKNAMRGRFYKPTKTSTTVRVDTDVLAWLKSKGKGYQTRINSILRNEMLGELAH